MPNVHTHASVLHDTSMEIESLEQELLPDSIWEEGIFATDMDQTMFMNDIGSLVFLQYLHNPNFYEISVETLESMLIPNETRWFFTKGIQGHIAGVSPQECQRVLDLAKTISQEFAIIKTKNVHLLSGNGKSILIRFITLICEFDSLLIHLKNTHPDPKISNKLAKQFSRYRLFAGQNLHIFNQVTNDAFAVSHDHPERILPIRTGDSVEYITDRLININRSAFDILERASVKGAKGYVVTASPLPIASSAIKHSRYSTIMAKTDIIATQLATCDQQRLTGQLTGEMIAGIQKKISLEEIQKKSRKKIVLALGDLPGSDSAMGSMALENNGVFMIFHNGNDLENTRNAFHKSLEKIMGHQTIDAASNRIWYIQNAPMDR